VVREDRFLRIDLTALKSQKQYLPQKGARVARKKQFNETTPYPDKLEPKADNKVHLSQWPGRGPH
jgi:hypothetical protein